MKLHTSNFVFRKLFILAINALRWLSPVTFTLCSYLLILLLGTHDEFLIVRECFLVLYFMTRPLIIVGILLLALDWIVIVFMEFTEEDLSQSLGLPLSAWFSLRLVSRKKRFEDTKDLSVFIDVTVGIFFFLLEQCNTGIHCSLACSYPLDSQGTDCIRMLVASEVFTLLKSLCRREIIVLADCKSRRAEWSC